MNKSGQQLATRRLLVVMPTWIGDSVMATPTLRALRQVYPEAHIAVLVRRAIRPILDGCPWFDQSIIVRGRRSRSADKPRGGPFRLARRLAVKEFDTAVLLPNSFRTALLVRLAGIPRRVGYDRDGRGFMLTDRLLPRRWQGRFIPVPAREYYLGIARYLGAHDPDPTMQLFTKQQNDCRVAELLRHEGFDPAGPKPLVIVNPGASYGDAKIWYPDRFAAVADRCVRELGATVAVTGAPNEKAILDEVIAAAREPIIDLPRAGIDLHLLKSVIKISRLLITNDTGPRHIAAALGIPMVTVFGPTDPAWTENDIEYERQVRVDVFCGPCQKKRCPLDHRCMTQISPDNVFEQVVKLLGSSDPVVGSPDNPYDKITSAS